MYLNLSEKKKKFVFCKMRWGGYFTGQVALNLLAFLLLFILNRFLPVSLHLRGMIVFLGAVALVVVQILLFFWRRVVCRLHGKWRSVVGKLFLVHSALSLSAPFLMKLMPGTALTELSLACYISNVWVLFLCLGFSLLRRILGRSKWSPHTESVCIIVGTLLFSGAATYEARLEYQVQHVKVHLGLPAPLSITLLSDLHLGPVLVNLQETRKSVQFCF
jgi:hypothetical protein